MLHLPQCPARIPYGAHGDPCYQSWKLACTRHVGHRCPARYPYGPSGSVCLDLPFHPTAVLILSNSCLIVKTDGYTRDQVAKVVQLRANTEGLKLGEGVIDRLATEGEKTSLR